MALFVPQNWYIQRQFICFTVLHLVMHPRFLLVLLYLPVITLTHAQSYDLIIKNGRVIDGTGNPWMYADVAIQNGRIVQIGTLSATDAKRTIDATGLVVAPGFIDVHAHVEGSLEAQPGAPNFIYDGVTTVITGNCGGSSANLRSYFDTLRLRGTSINVASLIGHNSIRLQVMNMAFRDPTAREQAAMDSLVLRAMQDGAVGLSTGLIYTPGTYAHTPEVVNLARVVARYGGVYASHIRNEGQNVKQAIEEAIQVGREAKIPVEISHFKVASKPLWGKSTETVELVESARREGLDVTVDQYPYTASSTSLESVLPSWVLADGDSAVLLRFRDPVTRAKIRMEMLTGLKKNLRKNYAYAVVASYKPDTTFNGLAISQINQKLGRPNTPDSEADLIMDLMERASLKRIQMVYHTMSETDVETILRYPNTMIASDAGVATFGSGMPHPRAYGTNARVLGRYVRERHVIPLEEAIRRMTSLPAQRFRLTDRGLIRVGYAADIVVFDEKTIADRATYEQPHAYTTGISWVIVNGTPVVDNTQHTGQRPGQLLMGPGYVTETR
jgi:N-acyl-D-amino-acid deacylase